MVKAKFNFEAVEAVPARTRKGPRTGRVIRIFEAFIEAGYPSAEVLIPEGDTTNGQMTVYQSLYRLHGLGRFNDVRALRRNGRMYLERV